MARAKTKPITSSRSPAAPPATHTTVEAASRAAETDRGQERIERDRFDDLYAQWLEHRGHYARQLGRTDKEIDDASDHEDELARKIVATPAPLPRMISNKLEVLKYYLSNEGGTNWYDNREIVMLAGIEADLLRFPPQ